MSNPSQLTAVTSFSAVVGVVLCLLRKKKKLTQSDMASAIGATVSTWSRIETGETAPTIEQLAQAADKLELDPSDILRLAEEMSDELRKKGVSTEPNRIKVQIEYAVSRGTLLPIAGAVLARLMKSFELTGVITSFLYNRYKNR